MTSIPWLTGFVASNYCQDKIHNVQFDYVLSASIWYYMRLQNYLLLGCELCVLTVLKSKSTNSDANQESKQNVFTHKTQASNKRS